MISTISLSLAAYQLYALLSGHPRISQLAHTPPWSWAIALWLAWLIHHLIQEARRA